MGVTKDQVSLGYNKAYISIRKTYNIPVSIFGELFGHLIFREHKSGFFGSIGV